MATRPEAAAIEAQHHLMTPAPAQLPAVQPVTPMQMLQVAMERGADLDKMQQLMDLHDRWQASEARKAFVAAMTRFKADPPEILKSKQVSFRNKAGTLTEYKHATLADVCAAATQGLARVGISHRWDVKQDAGKITVTCIVTHELGHSESVSMTAAADDSGGKNGIQAIASAMSYLERYTLLSITGLAAKDMDDDARDTAPPDTITEAQAADLHALAEEVGVNMAGFLRYLRVELLEDLPATKFQAAVAALNNKRTK